MAESGIKKIEAVVKKEKVPEVDKALRAVGVSGVTLIESAMGRGRDKLMVTSYVRGKWTFTTDYIQHSIFQVVVQDEDVDKVTKAITKAASTSHVGDGKIFISPVEKSIDISSGKPEDHGLT